MTGTEIVKQVRIMVNDVDKTTWSEASGNFLACLNEAIRIIYQERPESRLKADGTLRVYALLAAEADEIPLDDIYVVPLVEYLQYRFYDADAGDTRDKSRMEEHYKNFLNLLGIGS